MTGVCCGDVSIVDGGGCTCVLVFGEGVLDEVVVRVCACVGVCACV